MTPAGEGRSAAGLTSRDQPHHWPCSPGWPRGSSTVTSRAATGVRSAASKPKISTSVRRDRRVSPARCVLPPAGTGMPTSGASTGGWRVKMPRGPVGPADAQDHVAFERVADLEEDPAAAIRLDGDGLRHDRETTAGVLTVGVGAPHRRHPAAAAGVVDELQNRQRSQRNRPAPGRRASPRAGDPATNGSGSSASSGGKDDRRRRRSTIPPAGPTPLASSRSMVSSPGCSRAPSRSRSRSTRDAASVARARSSP